VIPNQVIDCPPPFTRFAERRLPQQAVYSIMATSPVLPGAPNIEDIDLIATRGQLRGKMVIRDRPERGIQPKSVAQDHWQLTGVVGLRPVVSDSQPPPIRRVCVAISARPEIGARCLATHDRAARSVCAEHDYGADDPPALGHEGRKSFPPKCSGA